MSKLHLALHATELGTIIYFGNKILRAIKNSNDTISFKIDNSRNIVVKEVNSFRLAMKEELRGLDLSINNKIDSLNAAGYEHTDKVVTQIDKWHREFNSNVDGLAKIFGSIKDYNSNNVELLDKAKEIINSNGVMTLEIVSEIQRLSSGVSKIGSQGDSMISDLNTLCSILNTQHTKLYDMGTKLLLGQQDGNRKINKIASKMDDVLGRANPNITFVVDTTNVTKEPSYNIVNKKLVNTFTEAYSDIFVLNWAKAPSAMGLLCKDGSFILLEGSEVNPNVQPEISNIALNLRKEYLKVFDKNISGRYVTQCDMQLKSPELALEFVTGSAINNGTFWITGTSEESKGRTTSLADFKLKHGIRK